MEKLSVLEFDQFNVTLNNHQLHGEYRQYRSINITADLRLIYRKSEDGTFYLITVDTHSNLYG